ncbi:MAG: glycosyltransferase family 2 protein [Candidatus Roizmanbacteria bacterium]
MSQFFVSIVIPVYNEEGNISRLLEKLSEVLLNFKYEIIFINDGSKDKTTQLIKKETSEKPNIKLISFYRNFGHQEALTCGYLYTQGDCVISIDADMQDPPDIIPEMIAKWQAGAMIVYAKREKRTTDNWFKKFSAQSFYKLLNYISDVPIPEDVGDFRLIDKEVVNFINKLPEKSKFLRGLVSWGGFPSDFVYFNRQTRHSGHTHYNIAKMFNLALDGITSFSTKPLQLATYIGFLSASIGFLGVLYAIVGKLFLPAYWITGWTALFVGIMFLGGVQLITIGIIGEYISKIYKEVQKRPNYIIEEKINIQ